MCLLYYCNLKPSHCLKLLEKTRLVSREPWTLIGKYDSLVLWQFSDTFKAPLIFIRNFLNKLGRAALSYFMIL